MTLPLDIASSRILIGIEIEQLAVPAFPYQSHILSADAWRYFVHKDQAPWTVMHESSQDVLQQLQPVSNFMACMTLRHVADVVAAYLQHEKIEAP